MSLKKITILSVLTLLFSIPIFAQTTKTVAILDVVDKKNNVDDGVKLLVRGSLTYAISNMGGYEAFTRVDMKSIMDEQVFQRTGNVSDAQIKQLGKMTGASYVLVPEVAKFGDAYVTITAQILDVESAGVKASADPQISSIDPVKMREACIQIARTLFKKTESTPNKKDESTQNKTFTSRPVAIRYDKETDNKPNKTPSYTSNSSQSASTLTFTVGNVSFEMIKVEAGSFIMGCTSEQGNDCYDRERPCHRVTISKDYYIGKFEVTQELYEAVMGTNPSKEKAFNHPVVWVSWQYAVYFCKKLSQITGRNFTLPTEAEWEYAARGGKKTTSAKYSGSTDIATVAWCLGRERKTHPVGSLKANELGIYDMSGNVSEWCLDWYGDYKSTPQTDPIGPTKGEYHIIRGGNYDMSSRASRITHRDYESPNHSHFALGFRVVLH